MQSGAYETRIETHRTDEFGLLADDFNHLALALARNEALAQLFDRLYRVDKSRSRQLGGAGLGLAICRNIVNAHAGHIEACHSALGGLAAD